MSSVFEISVPCPGVKGCSVEKNADLISQTLQPECQHLARFFDLIDRLQTFARNPMECGESGKFCLEQDEAKLLLDEMTKERTWSNLCSVRSVDGRQIGQEIRRELRRSALHLS